MFTASHLHPRQISEEEVLSDSELLFAVCMCFAVLLELQSTSEPKVLALYLKIETDFNRGFASAVVTDSLAVHHTTHLHSDTEHVLKLGDTDCLLTLVFLQCESTAAQIRLVKKGYVVCLPFIIFILCISLFVT